VNDVLLLAGWCISGGMSSSGYALAEYAQTRICPQCLGSKAKAPPRSTLASSSQPA
jgi:hypothetical protein